MEKEHLEAFNKTTSSMDELIALVAASANQIFALTIRQLPSHLDIGAVCELIMQFVTNPNMLDDAGALSVT